MIRRPPRSTPLSLHDALPIWFHLEHHAVLARLREDGRDQPLAEGVVEGDVDGCGRDAEPPRGIAVDRNKRLQRSEEHTSELQSLAYLVCRLLLEKKKTKHSCT